MSKLPFIFLLGVNILFLSCNQDCEDDICFENEEDFHGTVYVKISTADQYDSIIITLYQGNYEENNVLRVEKASSETRINLGDYQAGKDYSATAFYYGDQKILAVDGKEMKVKDDDCDCPKAAKDLTLNLKLK